MYRLMLMHIPIFVWIYKNTNNESKLMGIYFLYIMDIIILRIFNCAYKIKIYKIVYKCNNIILHDFAYFLESRCS